LFVFAEIEFVIGRMLVNGTEEAKAGNPFQPKNIGVEKLLELNSLQEINQDYCLGYIFTYRDFNDGVLGLAWVGSAKGRFIRLLFLYLNTMEYK
jgi:disintegrin and metalloproteinase domain-containing protein 10